MPLEMRLKRILPDRMWQLRKRSHLSLREVANLTGLSMSAVGDLEKGQSPNPHLITVAEVGRVLLSTLDGLLGWNVLGYNGQPLIVAPPGLVSRCEECGTLLLPRVDHMRGGGRCMLACWQGGMSDRAIANKFGHTVESVAFIVGQEIRLERLRPSAPVFADRRQLLGGTAA